MQTFRLKLKDYYDFLGEGGKDPYVDVYLPYNLAEMGRQNDHRPAMVICPGGGYSICSEREAEPVALKFLDMGFNVFVLYYSVHPHRYPAQLIEVAALFDLINKKADEFHCDTEKIGIIGFSAGGHLTAHYSNLWNDSVVKEHFGAAYKPAASVLCYPVISTRDAHRGSFESLIGHFPETDDEINRFSCEKLVGNQTPPTFLFHTSPDGAVPVQNSLYYAQALAENKVPFELHIYPFGEHGISTADTLSYDNVTAQTLYTGDWIRKLKNWLSVIFEQKISAI